MSNIFGTNTTSDLMSVAETAQKIMQGKSLTEDWLEAEMRKVQHKWPRTNPKIKKQWLDKQKARAEKDGMDMSAGGEFEDRLDDYELTIHADDKVWTEASKIKSKWKKMSTAQRTKWLDKIDDLARKQNTSDEDVRAIRDEFGLHMSEEVEVAEAVLDEALKPGDKRVIDAFYDQKEIKAHGASMLTTDGKTLTKRGMGGQDIAKYVNGKIKIVAVSDVKSTEEILRYMKKSIPSGVFEEVEIKEEFWAVIDKAKGGEVMAVSSDEKGAKSSVKMSNFSKHDYHFGKDPRTLKIVKVAGNYKQGEKMIGTKLSFKEEVEVDESNELQAIMALDDAGIEATINKKDQVVIKKKDLKKAEKALKKSFKKGGAPELHTEEVEITEIFSEILLEKKITLDYSKPGSNPNSPAARMKKAFDDAGIKMKPKAGKIVVAKKDKEKASGILGKLMYNANITALNQKDKKIIDAALDKFFIFEEVEIDEAVNLKKLKKEYEKNEDDNYHRENYLLLAKAFGTKSEIKKVEEIMKRSEANNSTSQKDNDWMYKNIMPYYNKIRNEEVEIGEKIEKESYGSFITAAAKAKKEGKKTFMMGGKKYPVTIKQKISAAYEEAKLYAAKGTAYPATIDTLKMIVREKQNQTVMFKSGKAIVDLFTASAMVQVYDALKKPEMKKTFEKMIGDKAGFLKTQAFAMKMISGGK